MSYLYVGGLVLMIKKFERENDPNSGLYTLPGGKVEDWQKGTNPQGRLESVIEETKTETGLILINPIFKGLIIFDNSERIFDNWSDPEDYPVYLFSAHEYTGKLKKRSDEGIPIWVSESDIPNVPKSQGDAKIYEWLKDPRYFVGVIKHKGKEVDEENTFVDYF